MKKITQAVCLSLVGILVLLTAACGRGSGDGDGTGGTGKTGEKDVGSYTESRTAGSGDRYIVSGNRFRIVFGERGADGNLNSAAALLYNLVKDYFGQRMDVKSDGGSAEQEYEILIGHTNRAGNVSAEGLTYYDYGWTFDGKKLRIYGGSDEALENAVNRFVELYQDRENNGLVVATGERFGAVYTYPHTAISLGSAEIGTYTVAARTGYEAAAKAVCAGFGRLCGVRLAVALSQDEPTGGNYIYVGFGATEDLNMLYECRDGILRFVGNGLDGEFNQTERLVELFFEKEFSGVTAETVHLETVKETKVMPNIENMQFADSEFIGMLDRNFESARDAILNAESEYSVTGGGKIYYVSSSEGNDANDGMSEAKPWKTLARVNNTSVPAGSVILFRRGDIWNMEGRFLSKANVTFSAYGTGAKPVFANYIDASKTSDWTNVGENLWVYSGSYETPNPPGKNYDGIDISDKYPKLDIPGSYITSVDGADGNDIGNIIFNDDEGWGVKITKKNAVDTSIELGTVPTGFGTLTHHARPFTDQKNLAQNLEYYHNPTESRLYLYCDGGNPAEVYSQIKLVVEGYCFYGGTESVSKNVTLDNLAFKYWGCHGISVNQTVDFTVRNCEIGWCGGSVQGYTWGGRDEPTRFGEGIQNWGNCKNFRILNNYLHQIFDGATSSQQSSWAGLTRVVMENVEVTNNCYENNASNIEFWMNINEQQANNENFKCKDWDISGNLMRRTGCGFGRARAIGAGSNGGQVFADSFNGVKPLYENVRMHDNTTWGNACSLVDGFGWGTERYNLEGNIFVHEYGSVFGHLERDFNNLQLWDYAEYRYDSETLAMLMKKNILGENTYYYTYTKK